jgi:hypothetical protein
VYDPKAKEEGVFVWKNGKPDTDKFLVEPDAPIEEATRAVKQAKDVSGKPGAGGMVGDLAQFVDRLDAIEKRQKLILATLALIGLIALAWPLAVTAFLPDLIQRTKSAPPAPPVTLPPDDPTARPPRL